MKTMQFLLALTVVLGVSLNLAACAAPSAPGTDLTPIPASSTAFTDAFAYCQAVGTADTPDARYTGPKMPDAVANGLRKAVNAPADAPQQLFTNNAFWRCMNGKVYACTVGANLPCTAKANTDKTPTTEENDFCKANPNADVIPAVVTGRETVFEWRCTNGAPQAGRQVVQPDARGFISNIWYEIKQ